jgi:hypothetical protein
LPPVHWSDHGPKRDKRLGCHLPARATLYTERSEQAIEQSSAISVEPDDALVVQQVLAGNTALFELLMRRYNERIYRAARSIVRDEQEAEDVMQQVYVNAFAHT